jgi:2,3-bisphosphoglycerate-independent phosphoglycerate mutase
LKSLARNSNFHIVLIFWDGVGIGEGNPGSNPFFCADIPALKSLCGGEFPHKPFKRISTRRSEIISLDTSLGIAGLPQSGTNQTAIFTGVNGVKKFGRHFGPYPPSVLHTAIEKKNIFSRLKAIGKSSIFANAYPEQFFEYVKTGTKRLTVTTLSCKYAGIPLLTVNDLRKNAGISADFIRAYWKDFGYRDVAQISPFDAGKDLAGISSMYDFTLFEYWLTDHAGHAQKMRDAVKAIENFDLFLSGFLSAFNDRTTLLVIVSDHGNIEDLSVKSHTRNDVPCIFSGRNRKRIAGRVKTLMHITPAIIRMFADA